MTTVPLNHWETIISYLFTGCFFFLRSSLSSCVLRCGGSWLNKTFSKIKWRPAKQMWHYNRVLKKLDIYWGSFICLSTLSSLAVPITLRTEQEWEDQALGWVGAGQTQWGEPFNGLWEDRPVDEWTPELMGSVSTKLLRKENPSQGGHFTFYFYCMSHRLFSSAGFSGRQRESKERTFFFFPLEPRVQYMTHEQQDYTVVILWTLRLFKDTIPRE